MTSKAQNVYVNPSSQIKTTCDDKSDSDGRHKGSQGLAGVFSNFADRCSISGMPFITRSKNRGVRALWFCLLVAAFGLMTSHLYVLFATYFERKIQTQVKLSFSSLQFPAVTICNVNPIRMSQRDLASDELKKFMDSVNPSALEDDLEPWWVPDLEDPTDDFFKEQDFFLSESDPTFMTLEKRRKKRQPNAPDNGKRGVKTNQIKSFKSKSRTVEKTSEKINQKGKVIDNSFLDDLDFSGNFTFDLLLETYEMMFEQDSWEAEAPTSSFYEKEQEFRRLFASEPVPKQSQMGHQINNMLLQCSFAGRKCFARNFTRSLTTRYGNCYTLQYPKFISRSNDPSYGLQLKLFLETDDYVPGIADSKGIQVVIHDQGTLPFPEEDGMAVKAGTETFIGLRRVEVSRLSEPYGKCTSVNDFKTKHGIKYTRSACQKICREMRTREVCACYDLMQQEVNGVLKPPGSLKPCQTKKESQCVLVIFLQFEKNNDMCDCHRPCS